MKKIALSVVLSYLLLTGGLCAKETVSKDVSVKEVNHISVQNAKSDAKENQETLVKEALDSLKEASEALQALKKKDAKKATLKLENALGKLEVILASSKVPKLLPIDSIVKVHEFIGTSEDVRQRINTIMTLINKNKIQEARALMLPLKSEIDITTVSLPLGSYPDAIKLAAKYVHSNNLDKAQEVLSIALSTFTSVTKIVPLPLVKATGLVIAAEEISKENKEQALKYLDGAIESLKIAHALGYVSKSQTTYKMLQDQVEVVQKEIRGPNKAEKLFERLKHLIEEFKEKVFSEKSSENNQSK